MDKKVIAGLTLEQRADLFDRDRRLEIVLNSMALALVDAGHTWTNDQRKGFDWAARTLSADQKELAAA